MLKSFLSNTFLCGLLLYSMSVITFYKLIKSLLLMLFSLVQGKMKTIVLCIILFDSQQFIVCFIFVNLLLRYDIPQYGSRRRLITPMYDEYGEVIMEDDGYYYGPEVITCFVNVNFILSLIKIFNYCCIRLFVQSIIYNSYSNSMWLYLHKWLVN